MYRRKCTCRAREVKIRGNIHSIEYPAWASYKIDGMYVWLVKNHKETFLLNKNGFKVTDESVTCAVEEMLGKKTCLLVGELAFGSGKAGDLYKLKKDNTFGWQLHLFDIYHLNGKIAAPRPFSERKKTLHSIFLEGKVHKHQGKGKRVNNPVEATLFYQEAIDAGYEGIVVKELNAPLIFGSSRWVKMKYKDENNYRISKIDPVRDRIEVLVDYPGPLGKVNLKKVGVKVISREKASLRVGEQVKIEHQGVLSGGGLRHPVYRGKV